MESKKGGPETSRKGLADIILRAVEPRELQPEERLRESPIVVKDIPTLVGALRELTTPEHWVFRGQRDWDWKLTPKPGRPHENAGEGFRASPYGGGIPSAIRMIEKAIFDDWTKEASALLSPLLPKPSSVIEWLAIGQHSGLKTRLLDWSRNPLVGAYFAARETDASQDSALFALRGVKYLESDYEKDPWGVRGVRLWHPPSLRERMGRQSALFTLHQIGDLGGTLSLDQYAKELWYDDYGGKLYPGDWVPELVKIRIDGSARVALKEELRLLGVDEFYAFPDLDGLCRAYGDGRFLRPGVRQMAAWKEG